MIQILHSGSQLHTSIYNLEFQQPQLSHLHGCNHGPSNHLLVISSLKGKLPLLQKACSGFACFVRLQGPCCHSELRPLTAWHRQRAIFHLYFIQENSAASATARDFTFAQFEYFEKKKTPNNISTLQSERRKNRPLWLVSLSALLRWDPQTQLFMQFPEDSNYSPDTRALE